MLSSSGRSDSGSDSIDFQQLNREAHAKGGQMLRNLGRDLVSFLWEAGLFEYSDSIERYAKDLTTLKGYDEVQLQALIDAVHMMPKDADKLREMLGTSIARKLPVGFAVPSELKTLLQCDQWKDVESQINGIANQKVGAIPGGTGSPGGPADVNGGAPTLTATAFGKHRVGADIIKDIKADGIRPGMCGAQMIREMNLSEKRMKREQAAVTMFEAVSKGNLDAVRKLIQNTDTVDTRDDKNQTPLIVAATVGYQTIMEELLNANAAPNAVRADNRTALMCCAEKGHHACVTLLLQHAAYVDHKDNSTATALVLAVTRGHNECVSILLKEGADIEATDNLGRTSLMLAAFLGQKHCLDLLIEHGANVNAKVEAVDKNGFAEKNDRMTVTMGRTAFHWACLGGQLECVKALIAAGCNTSVIDNEKKTGHDLAQSKVPNTGNGAAKSRGKTKGKSERRETGKSSGPHLAVVRFLDQRSIEASEELLKTEFASPAPNASQSKKEKKKKKKREQRLKSQEASLATSAYESKLDDSTVLMKDSKSQSSHEQSTTHLCMPATSRGAAGGVQGQQGRLNANQDGILSSIQDLVDRLGSCNQDLAQALQSSFNRIVLQDDQQVANLRSGPPAVHRAIANEHEQLLSAWDAKYAALKQEKEGLERQLEQQQTEYSIRIEEAWQGSKDDTQTLTQTRLERDTARAEVVEVSRRVRRFETMLKEKDTNIAELMFQLTTARQDAEKFGHAYVSKCEERSEQERHTALELQRARAEARRLAETLDIERTQFTLERQQFRSEMQAVQRGRFEIEQRLSEKNQALHNIQIDGRTVGRANSSMLTDADRRKMVKNLLVLLQKVVNSWAMRCAAHHKFEGAGMAYIFTFGSHCLDVDDIESDVDVLVLAPHAFNRDEDFFGRGTGGHSWSLVHMLRSDERVSDLVIVADAHVPLLKLKFDGVDFDLTFANGLDIHGDVPMQPIGGWGADPLRSLRPNWQAEMQHDMQAYRSVNGVLGTQAILKIVPDVELFTNLLRHVKCWAKNRGIYGSIIGYLGGISWALLVAVFCRDCCHSIEAHITQAGKQPALVISGVLRLFFNHWSRWAWPQEVVLHREEHTAGSLPAAEAECWDPSLQPALLPILTPVFPHMNTAHTSELKRAARLLDNQHRHARWPEQWQELAAYSQLDFRRKYSMHVRIDVQAPEGQRRSQWLALVNSSIRHVIRQLEHMPIVAAVQCFAQGFDRSALDPIRDALSASTAMAFIVGMDPVRSASQTGESVVEQENDRLVRACTDIVDELTGRLLTRAQNEGWYCNGMGLTSVILMNVHLDALLLRSCAHH